MGEREVRLAAETIEAAVTAGISLLGRFPDWHHRCYYSLLNRPRRSLQAQGVHVSTVALEAGHDPSLPKCGAFQRTAAK